MQIRIPAWLVWLGTPWLLYGLFSAVMGAAYALAVMGDTYMRAQTLRCASPAAARAAGTYLDTVLVTPRTVQYGRFTVVFDTCWVEQLRESRRPAWYARRTVGPLPEAEVRLRYHVRSPGRWPTDPDEPPLLVSDRTYGRQTLDSAGAYSVSLAILPDDYYGGNLPLRLGLTHGGCAPDTVRFTAMPAHAYRAQP